MSSLFILIGAMNTCDYSRENNAAAGAEYSGPVGIEIRGSTSARDYEKKSFAVETRKPDGDSDDVNLLGEFAGLRGVLISEHKLTSDFIGSTALVYIYICIWLLYFEWLQVANRIWFWSSKCKSQE